MALGDRPIRVLGQSDPLTSQTGFGRVARELFSRLADLEEYDLAFMSRGWVGTRRWPTIKTYVGTSEFCQNEFPMAAIDFAGVTDPLILWTLHDPWQVGWISNYDGNNVLNTKMSTMFWRQNRERVKWIGHFPVDGYGPQGRPPLWMEDFLNGPDVTVFMSDFGRRIMEPYMKKPWRVIKHAIDADVYRPYEKSGAREKVEAIYRAALTRTLQFSRGEDGQQATEEQVQEEVEQKRLRLQDRFTIIVVMANRERKLWPLVLEAFTAFRETAPEARLIGICGDRTADRGGTWPLVDYARMLGLERTEDPVVWLIDNLGKMPWEEDLAMAIMYAAADLSLLISTGEGFGLPQLESHACGTPCIVGRYSASEELAVDPREMVEPKGYTYAGTNMVRRPNYIVRDVVNRMEFAYRHPGWRTEVGARGVEQARAHDWKIILPQWRSLFEEVWDGRTGEASEGEPVGGPADAQAG